MERYASANERDKEPHARQLITSGKGLRYCVVKEIRGPLAQHKGEYA